MRTIKAFFPYFVILILQLLHDTKRHKDLPVTVYYPVFRGVYPIIIFSHGAGGSGDSNLPLLRYWASSGYICLSPTHEDSNLWPHTSASVGVRQILLKNLNHPERWKNRAEDISFLIDSLHILETKVPALNGKMDAANLAVAGHSFGAYTAQIILGPAGRKKN